MAKRITKTEVEIDLSPADYVRLRNRMIEALGDQHPKLEDVIEEAERWVKYDLEWDCD